MSTLIVARLTFKEASRRKVLLAALLLGLVFLAVFGLGFYFLRFDLQRQRSGVNPLLLNEINNFLTTAGLYVVNFLTVMMAVLTSVDTLSGEITSGTIHTLVSKPIRRWEVVLGKWLGFAGMLTLYLILMAGGVMAISMILAGYWAPHSERALLLMWLNALLLLTVSFLGGATFSTLANGVMVFGLYGISFIGGWIEQIGSYIPNPTSSQMAVKIGVITSLILPSEALWRRAAYEIQSPVVAAMGYSPFTARSIPSLLMIAYAVLYLVVIFVLAVRKFRDRDL